MASGDHSRSYVYASPGARFLFTFVTSKCVAQGLALHASSSLHAIPPQHPPTAKRNVLLRLPGIHLLN